MGLANARLCNFLGMCYGQLGDANRCIDLHKEAYALDGTMQETALNAGQMCKEVGRWREALEHFQQALDACPGKEYVPARSYRGSLWYLLGRPVRAERDLLRATTVRLSLSLSLLFFPRLATV